MQIEIFLKHYDLLKGNKQLESVKKLVDEFANTEIEFKLNSDICEEFIVSVLKLINSQNQIAQFSGLQLLLSSCTRIRPFIGKGKKILIVSSIFKRIGDSKIKIREIANINLRRYSYLIDLKIFEFLVTSIASSRNFSQKENGLLFLADFMKNNFSMEYNRILQNLVSIINKDSNFKLRQISEKLATSLDLAKKFYASFRPIKPLLPTSRTNIIQRKLSNDTLDRTTTPIKENFYSQKNSRQNSPERRKPISYRCPQKKCVSKQDLMEMWKNNIPCQLLNFKVGMSELTKLNETLVNTSIDWNKRIIAMKKLRGVVEKFSVTDLEYLSNQLNNFTTSFTNSIKDLRSKINIEIFSTIGYISYRMSNKNVSLFENLLPVILRLFTSSAMPITSSARACLELIFSNCRSLKMLNNLKDHIYTSKSVPIRRQCASLYLFILTEWEIDFIEKYYQIFESTIKMGITDADNDVRHEISLSFWQYLKKLKKNAILLYSSLNDRQKNILRSKCPTSVFDLNDSLNRSPQISFNQIDNPILDDSRPINKTFKPNHDLITIPKPIIVDFQSIKISDNLIRNQENVDQTQLDSSNLMYGPAGSTPFIQKTHFDSKLQQINGDDLLLELKLEAIYIDLESGDSSLILNSLDSLASIFKRRSKIPISYIYKLQSSLENLLDYDQKDIVNFTIDVIINFVPSYHLKQNNWLTSLFKKVLLLSRSNNFSNFTTKIEQLVHVLQTIVNDDIIVRFFIDFIPQELKNNYSEVFSILYNLLINSSDSEIDHIMERIYNCLLEFITKSSDIMKNVELQNILQKIAGLRESQFQKWYDSLTCHNKSLISQIFLDKTDSQSVVSVFEDNITCRKQKNLSDENLDIVKKSIIESSTFHLSKSIMEQLLMNLKETLEFSDDCNDVFTILKCILNQEIDLISSQLSNIIDIIGFFLKKEKDLANTNVIINDFVLLISIPEAISYLKSKISILNISECERSLNMLKYVLLRCDNNNKNMIEIIELLPKLFALWMSESPKLLELTLECMFQIRKIIGNDKFNLFTLSLTSEKKILLNHLMFKNQNNNL